MQGKRKKKKRKEAILGIVLDGKAYSAPFALYVPVTDTRARAAAVCVCVHGHTRGLSASKFVSGFPRHLFVQPSVEQVRQCDPHTTLSISGKANKVVRL